MFSKRTGVAVASSAAFAGWTTAASAMPRNWAIGFQPAASPVMQNIETFHNELLWIITAVCVFVLALLVWTVVRYNQRTNATPSKVHHNTVLEVAWTIVPVAILVVIAVPSFRLLYFEADIPKSDVVIKAIGKQWFWTYEFPRAGGFQFDSLGLSNPAADKANEPHLLGVDNQIEVPVNKVVEVVTTGADVIHSWALPEMGVKMDAIPGRLNHTWFKANRTGTFYGECSELCGAKHAYMPIEVKVVSQAEYDAWVAAARKKYAASRDPGAARLAAN
jgi:cytochrome c oxidase subunit II